MTTTRTQTENRGSYLMITEGQQKLGKVYRNGAVFMIKWTRSVWRPCETLDEGIQTLRRRGPGLRSEDSLPRWQRVSC